MNKPYRVAVIGSTGRGNYGHGVDKAWLALPQTEAVAVADPDADGRAKAAKRVKVDKTYADYRKMLDEVKPDIVAICPRWLDQHRDMAVAAAERGIHIYIEKPFCRSLEEADEIVSACERTHAKLALAVPTRYSPKLETVKGLIEEGKIGTVLEYRGRGKEDRRGGGEDLWVLGTHIMDLIRALGGHPKGCMATVTAGGRPVTKKDVAAGKEGIGPLAGDAVHAMYGMPDGSMAYFSSVRNMTGRPWRYGLQILGSRGVLEVMEGPMASVKYLGDPSWCPGRSGKEWQDVSSAGIGKPEPRGQAKYTARHTQAILNLLDAIEKKREPKAGVYEARGATEMIAAVFESHRARGPVTLPLKNRENPLTLLD